MSYVYIRQKAYRKIAIKGFDVGEFVNEVVLKAINDLERNDK